MIADLPPLPAYQCVASQVDSTWRMSLSGSAPQVEAALSKVTDDMTVEAKAETNGIAFVLIRFTPNAPWRYIGSLMTEAQRRQLTIGQSWTPPICSKDED